MAAAGESLISSLMASLKAKAIAGLTGGWSWISWLVSLGLDWLAAKLIVLWKHIVAQFESEKHVKENAAEREQITRRAEEEIIKSGGELSKEAEDRIREERIKNETDGFNGS